MGVFLNDQTAFLKVHCGGLHVEEVLQCALNNESGYFGRGIIRCDNSSQLYNVERDLNKLGYKYTKLSDAEANGLLNLPDKFVKTFVVDWYEKESRAWAEYRKGGYK